MTMQEPCKPFDGADRRSARLTATSMSELEGLDRPALIERWKELIGSPPPPHASVTLLRTAIAYEMQTKAIGTIPKRIERVLAAALRSVGKADMPGKLQFSPTSAADPAVPASNLAANDDYVELPTQSAASATISASGLSPPAQQKPVSAITAKLAPGTQLVREWNGRTWQVEVVKGGFVCKGKRYRSLSAIAKMITDAHWSGPRFFGLRS